MAIPYTKDDAFYQVCKQATFGTAIAGTAAFNTPTGFIIDCEPTAFDGDHKERRPNRSQAAKRNLDVVNYTIDNKGANPKITFTGEAKYNDIAHLFYSVVQNVSEAALTPFDKTFTWSATQPAFQSNAGWFATVAEAGPTLAQSIAATDMIGTRLNLKCAPGQRLMYAWDLMGRGAINYTYDLSSPGTTTRSAAEYFHFEDITVCTVNSVELYPTNIDITWQNNAIPVSVDPTNPGTGKCRDFALGTGNGYECFGKLRVLWDGNSQDLQQLLVSGSTPLAYAVNWGVAGTDGHLGIALTATVRNATIIPGDVREAEIDFVTMTNSGNAPISVVVADAIDRSW